MPRVWDDPERREAESGNGKELARPAGRFKEVNSYLGSRARAVVDGRNAGRVSRFLLILAYPRSLTA